MLGVSDAWSISRSFQGPSKLGYYIEDCHISSLAKEQDRRYSDPKARNG